MLNLKPYKEARETFAKNVTTMIQGAQQQGITHIYFHSLPNPILNELSELGYPVNMTGSGGYNVTVL